VEKLPLTVACGDYDRTKSLQDGAVQPEGIRLKYLPLLPAEIFGRMTGALEFDAAEMSLSDHVALASRGDSPFVGIPVFTSRYFRQSCIFINTDAGIALPQDLKGKRIGVPGYAITAAVWIRGILSDEYGVSVRDVEWLTGGLNETGRTERVPLKLTPEIRVNAIPDDKTLDGMLESGEIPAVISARTPASFAQGSPRVGRLFPDYKQVEIDYYKRTKIFPIMHVIVVRKDLYERHPWVARSLYKAFCESKERAVRNMHVSNTLACTLPWLFAEIELVKSVLGSDWWPYGIEPNRRVLATLIRYMGDQGLIDKPIKVEDLFAPNTAGEFKI
jgi:4,5-dihydroxyphthalate decarboxylase